MIIDTRLYILRMFLSILIYTYFFYKIYFQTKSPKKLKIAFLGLLIWFIFSIFLGDFIEIFFVLFISIYYIFLSKDLKKLNIILILFISIKFININSSYIIIYIYNVTGVSSNYLVYFQLLLISIQVVLYIRIYKKHNFSTYIYSFLSLSLTLLLLYIYLSIFFITYIFNKIYYFERFIDLLLFFIIMQGTFIFFLIFYENRVQREQELKRNNELKFENINFYSKLIEKKNLEIQKFNHDLNNIIISINEESKEVQSFKKELSYISKYIKDLPFSSNKVDTHYFNNINNPYLKNLFLNKIEVMMNKGISFNFECLHIVSEIKRVHILDIVRIIGILCDNAIEETEKINDGFINIYIYQDNGLLEVFVENNFLNDNKLSIHKLIEPGFSTKEEHKGLGLTIIEDIIEKNKYISVNYEINNNDNIFKAILIINIS